MKDRLALVKAASSQHLTVPHQWSSSFSQLHMIPSSPCTGDCRILHLSLNDRSPHFFVYNELGNDVHPAGELVDLSASMWPSQGLTALSARGKFEAASP